MCLELAWINFVRTETDLGIIRKDSDLFGMNFKKKNKKKRRRKRKKKGKGKDESCGSHTHTQWGVRRGGEEVLSIGTNLILDKVPF